jgi:hypothetical protein
LGELVFTLAYEHEHLVAARCIGRATAGDEDAVGVRAIGTGGRVLVQHEAIAAHFDGANARARVAGGAYFGGHRREHVLLVDEFLHVVAEEL